MKFAIPRADLTVRDIESETVVLDRAAGQMHTLNPTASFIWRLLDGNTSQEDIAQKLARAYDIDVGVARDDVRRTLEGLNDLRLLRTTGD